MKHFYRILPAMMTALAVSGTAADFAADAGNLPFPYIWDSQINTDDFAGETSAWDDWQYQPAYKGYRIFATKRDWTGKHLATVSPVDLPASSDVAFSFMYNASNDVTVFLKLEENGQLKTVGSVDLPGNQNNYNSARIEFKADGPSRIFIEAHLTGGEGNCYGSLIINELKLTSGGCDLAFAELLSPFSTKLPYDVATPVTARFENLSSSAVTDPVFAYSLDNGATVRETYHGTVGAGETLTYTFGSPLMPGDAGKKNFAIWCEASGDVDSTNDRFEATVDTYHSFDFPYTSHFSDDINCWTLYDVDNDDWGWLFGQLEDGGSTVNVLGYQFAYGSYDDYAISPAIRVPAGKSRLAFYYAGQDGGAHLTVKAGGTPDPGQMTETLLEFENISAGWQCAYATFDSREERVIYVAFHITGGNDQLVIRQFSVDNYEDLCIGDIRFTGESGFGLTSMPVAVTVANYGLTPQSDIKVRYAINNSDTFVEETISGTINPGEMLSYTFATPADVSAEDRSYDITGYIATEVGPDRYNDAMRGTTLHHYRTLDAPYANTFTDTSTFPKWHFTSDDPKCGWAIRETVSPYYGTAEYYEGNMAYVLWHTNRGSGNADSWAFSERIHLEPGTYDISFFYRTAPNYFSNSHRQDFGVFLGTGRSAQEMTLPVAAFDGILLHAWTKSLVRITIENAGDYYIGFHNTAPASSGGTLIDYPRIIPVRESAELPYAADWHEWEAYDPSGDFINWTITTDGIWTEREQPLPGVAYNKLSEGLIVSPPIHLTEGNEVEVSFEYRLNTEAGDLALNLYGAETDMPAEYRVLGSFGCSQDFTTATYTFTPAADIREWHAGIRTNMSRSDDELLFPYGYIAEIRNFTVKHTGQDGLHDVRGETFSIDGNVVSASSDDSLITIYDISGRTVAVGKGSVHVPEGTGMCIISVRDSESDHVIKHMF